MDDPRVGIGVLTGRTEHHASRQRLNELPVTDVDRDVVEAAAVGRVASLAEADQTTDEVMGLNEQQVARLRLHHGSAMLRTGWISAAFFATPV